jgi:molybdate transport system substrate-binding protein
MNAVGQYNPIPGEKSLNRFTFSVLIIVSMVTSCRPDVMPTHGSTFMAPADTPEPRNLTIFAAASLLNAFTEIGQNFEAGNSGVTITFNFAGSGTLRTQLEQGAVADVFASANMTEMNTIVADNLVAADAPQLFLTNSLLVILPSTNPANIQSLQDLTLPGIRLVLCDATVPCGKYARQILVNMDTDTAFSDTYSTEVLANLVSNEIDVKQVVAKVQLGEADAGIVYVSDAVAASDMKTIEFPAADNVIAQYPIAPLRSAPQPDLADDFVVYVLSPEGQIILKKWGFIPVTP